jgi:hypothetical protein
MDARALLIDSVQQGIRLHISSSVRQVRRHRQISDDTCIENQIRRRGLVPECNSPGIEIV